MCNRSIIKRPLPGSIGLLASFARIVTKVIMQPVTAENDRRFLDELHRMGSATVQDLCDRMDVTATAVRQRLVRLQSQGFVSRVAERAGRGRPRFMYRVTEAGSRELGDNYSELAVILWKEIRSIEDLKTRQRLMGRIRDSLAQRYSRRLATDAGLTERFQRLGSELNQSGFSVEVDRSGDLPILREHYCPYLDLAESDQGICELEQAVFQQVLGTAMELTQCCLDGHHCCEFQPAGVSPTDTGP